VGIAKEHAVTFAAGLALQGQIPVIALYSTFVQRAYDQLIHDIALDNLHAVICIDRAGLVGDDGPTHHGAFDLSFLRTIPNATIMAPADEADLRAMLYSAICRMKGPVFIRYPRGAARGVALPQALEGIEGAGPRQREQGESVAIVSVGHALELAEQVREQLTQSGVSVALYDARFVKPLDSAAYGEIFRSYRTVVTIEHNTLMGGFGAGLLELWEQQGCVGNCRIVRIGYPDAFVPHGSIDQLLKDIGMDVPSIVARIRQALPDGK
jgi:1-deoxy-D-xylulose-5-phosphate synthase